LTSFDKSLFNGKGDYVAPEKCKAEIHNLPLDVLVFEEWCRGFQPLGQARVEEKWSDAQGTTQRLAATQLKDVLLMDNELEKYCQGFMGSSTLDLLIHLNVPTLETIYMWREEHEHKLRESSNEHRMTKNEILDFG
jgi:D-glycerate 3-kinase